MSELRPYVVASCAMSVDGYLDDASAQRLLVSNDADFDRVDAERAASDAIVVGANTIRRDNPRLLVRSPRRRDERVRRGVPSSPAKVTVTLSGKLDADQNFFAEGEPDVPRLVYCTASGFGTATALLGGLPAVEVVDAGQVLELGGVLTDLGRRGYRRVLVEGGTRVLTQLLAGGLADELQLVIAPFFVGGGGAPRFVDDASFVFDAQRRMTLAEVTQIGDVVLLRYMLPTLGADILPQ
jgi:5-amino-6-(5-phosphoribosylamino)uracil reductase